MKEKTVRHITWLTNRLALLDIMLGGTLMGMSLKPFLWYEWLFGCCIALIGLLRVWPKEE